MAKKKEVPEIHVSDCVFQAVVPAANEFTVQAITALAKAAEANANALGKMADALKGGNATLNTGLHLGDING